MRPLRLLCSAVVLATGFALPASAATLTLSAQNGSTVFGTNGSAGATILETTIRPAGLRVSAGGFAVKGDLNGNGVENFTAWCVDIATRLRLPSNYTTTTSPFTTGLFSATTLSNIERLFETGLSTLNLANNAQSAGFQLALWEVLYEKSGTFNLGVGNFKVSYSAAAIAAGQALLNGMSGPITRNFDMTYLQSTDARGQGGPYSQNLVTATVVPLPAAGILLLGALGGLAALRRRKTNLAA